ncbi:MAG: hypothetical protein PHY08_13175 [Candidatus Cloacimonetes bacterium]|nr:hypothetical protein [Candidatus Cloacimonadota bacterium]
MNVYTEDITDELKQKIKTFLNENKSLVVDYWTWRESLELYELVSKEIRQSVEGFRNEFDEIMEYYNIEHSSDVESAKEILLINKVNERLKNLYQRYIENKELRLLLNELGLKKYK